MEGFLKKHHIPILIFVAIGFFIFLPIINNLNSQILGNMPGTDNAQDGIQFIWNFWWAKKTCLGLCGDFWNTTYQFFPTGTSLLFQNFSYVNLAVMLPFMFLGLSPVAAFNISFILAIILSCVGAYFLVYYLTNSKQAGFISGLIYGISPFMIGHIMDGQLDLVSVGFFPLLFLALIKSDEERNYLYPILAGIISFLLTLASPTFIVFAFFILGFWFIYKLVTERKKYQEILKKLSVTFIVLIIPFLLFFHRQLAEINSFDVNGPTKWSSEFSSSDLAAFITPPRTSFLGQNIFKTDREIFNGIYSDKNVYLGFSIITLAILGIIHQKKNLKLLIPWVILGSLAFILSLGPKLHIYKKIVASWMPFGTLEKLPLFSSLRAPSRFSVFVFLSLAVLSGYGFLFLINKLRAKYLRIITIIGIIFLIAFEYFPFYKNTNELKLPNAYKKIQEDKTDFAILEVPLLWSTGLDNKGTWSPDYLYYQTIHNKKMPGGYITRTTKETFESYKNDPLLNFVFSEQNKLLSPNREAVNTLEKYKVLNTSKILADNKFKYIIFHGKEPTELNNRVKEVLKENLEMYFEDEKLEIYQFKNK